MKRRRRGGVWRCLLCGFNLRADNPMNEEIMKMHLEEHRRDSD